MSQLINLRFFYRQEVLITNFDTNLHTINPPFGLKTHCVRCQNCNVMFSSCSFLKLDDGLLFCFVLANIFCLIWNFGVVDINFFNNNLFLEPKSFVTQHFSCPDIIFLKFFENSTFRSFFLFHVFCSFLLFTGFC